jgi:hypothetical protein
MAHIHDEPVLRRDTTIIEDGRDTGSGFGAGVILGALAILAAVIIGVALLVTQPWDDNGGSGTTPSQNAPGVPGVPNQPNAPDVPNAPDAPSAPDSGGNQPAP